MDCTGLYIHNVEQIETQVNQTYTREGKVFYTRIFTIRTTENNLIDIKLFSDTQEPLEIIELPENK